MLDNKTLRTKFSNQYYVIIATRDGVEKYVSNKFPRDCQYTVKLECAKRFNDVYEANDFISEYELCNKWKIINPKVETVTCTHKLEANNYDS